MSKTYIYVCEDQPKLTQFNGSWVVYWFKPSTNKLKYPINCFHWKSSRIHFSSDPGPFLTKLYGALNAVAVIIGRQ